MIATLAAGGGLVAAAAWAQTGQVMLGPTVSASHNLPADAITGFTVTCPPGYLAVSGGVSSPGPGSTLLSARPVGARAFMFRFGNPAANDATRVTVAVACRKIRGGPLLKLKPVRTRAVVKPGRSTSGTLACPPQTTPAGASVDLDPSRARSAGSFDGAALTIRTSTADLRSFRFRIANAGDRAHDAVVQGNCMTVVIAPGVARTGLSSKISTEITLIAPGSHHVVRRCPAGWTSLGVGYALTSGPLRIDGAAALGRSASWWVRNTAGRSLKAQLQLTCARLS